MNKNKAPLDELLGCSNTDDWPVVFQKLVNEGYGEVAFTKSSNEMEEVVLGLTNGSYAQRVQAEYLKEVEERFQGIFQASLISIRFRLFMINNRRACVYNNGAPSLSLSLINIFVFIFFGKFSSFEL